MTDRTEKMPYCAFDEGAAVFDATPVDNMFITEYMLSAPGDFVKVYLYALMLCRHPQERMSDASLAKDLGMTEEDVYWTSLLAIIEMIKSGTTCFVDMTIKSAKEPSGPLSACAGAVKASGFRAVISRPSVLRLQTVLLRRKKS